ncbi:NlpC/P60 family protein [Streptomyces ficellus]|uniref:NlpC/P60 family protein n=1 Tax=Streptomyces ficellus TaxID=1977088 RepID=A0ABT7ZB30_9ACTN|nr:NlpC/P60 family protein [Streptomyces ficellus]MDN3296715.1 NlpC/P60 family protein [Streptomyces ficellus]
MAAHRKPRQRPLSGSAGRTAATLALAGAATATAFQGSGHAEPHRGPAQVRAEADRLYREAEVATEKYNGAKEEADEARAALDALRDEAARRTARLNTTRTALGSIATAQYRAGGLDPALQLALSADPDTYLRGAALAERVGDRQAGALTALQRQVTELAQLRTEAAGRLRDLRARQAELRRHKATVQDRIAAAEKLLDRLTAPQRAAYDRPPAPPAPPAPEAPAPTPARTTAPGMPDSRAAQAVSYAYGALGKPYVWGATGPSAFDCSGLTQAAWRSAGVSLPRTTYSQIGAGRRVPRSELAPGDLVFFYSGISHVGLYIGDGKMIHAPRPGAPVRIAPIDQMPWAGATRVG